MEAEPNHEIHEPLKFRCGNCGNNEVTTRENTTLFMYERDRMKNHLRIDCYAREGHVTIHFLKWSDEKEMEWASQFDHAVDENGEIPTYCEDESLIQVWRHHYDIKAVKEYEITGSQQKKLNFLKYLLEVTPDEVIHQEFSEPQPERTLPLRWD